MKNTYKGKISLILLTVLIVGDSQTGKSTILKKYAGNTK